MIVETIAQKIWCAMGDTKIEVFCTLLVFISVLLTVKGIQWYKHTCTLPPGPWGLPYFGYLFSIKSDVHLRYNELAKKYGPIFSIRMGNQLVVVLSNYQIIRDAFRREDFTGRPHTEFTNILGEYGVINSEGALWKGQRRLLQSKLRYFGMKMFYGGKSNLLESKIIREVNMLLRKMSQQCGTVTDFSLTLGTSISNVICDLIMGKRFYYGDQQFKRFMYLIEEGFKLFASIVFINYIPIMRYMPRMNFIRDKIVQNREEMAKFFQGIINQRRENFDRNNMRNLLDTYLLEIDQAKEEGRESQLFEGKDHDRQIQQILGDLFSAGMETVKTTLEWAILLMIHYPEAAKAVQDELDRVVGPSKMPTLKDLPFLPITEATIQEVHRRCSIVPLGTTHATTRDVKLNGYTIPAGSQVVPLLYAVHMSKELWGDPEAFRPARFLSSEGTVCKPPYFMPFGVGRRKCLGEELARMEIFLYFSSLMHAFDLRLPENTPLPSLRGIAGTTVSPVPFKFCLLKRQSKLPECVVNEIIDINEILDGPLRNVGNH